MRISFFVITRNPSYHFNKNVQNPQLSSLIHSQMMLHVLWAKHLCPTLGGAWGETRLQEDFLLRPANLMITFVMTWHSGAAQINETEFVHLITPPSSKYLTQQVKGLTKDHSSTDLGG